MTTLLYETAQKRIMYLQKQLSDNSLALEASEMRREDLEDEYIANTKVMCDALERLFKIEGVWSDE